MSDFVTMSKPEFIKAVEFLKSDIAGLRTGRATPALVEDMSVEAYGVKQPLKSLATILVQDAKTLLVSPWDKSVLQNIENAIRNNQTLNLNPVNDGVGIRIPLPELSTERRQELIKVLHQKLENARIAVRKIREDVRDMIDQAEKDKEISEDDKYILNDNLEKTVKETNEQIKETGEKKEQEILTI